VVGLNGKPPTQARPTRVARSGPSEAKAFAEKFNLSLDKAKQLMELHRAAVAREVKKPKKRSP
jgi:hypothetical protein